MSAKMETPTRHRRTFVPSIDYGLAEMTHSKDKIEIKCPYLIVPIIPTCLANEKPHVPSTVQLHEFCKTRENMNCPFFRTSIHKMRKMRENSAVI
jgi:hypothetical protein